MPWSRPSGFRRASLSSLDAVAITVAPARLASWMAAMPTPPAPAWTSTVSPRPQVPELEEAIVGGAEGNRHAGGDVHVEPVRQHQVDAAGTATIGVRAVRHHRHHRLPGRAVA